MHIHACYIFICGLYLLDEPLTIKATELMFPLALIGILEFTV